MTLGTKIRNLRTLKGYSQDNMAKMLGLSVTSYSKIERDEVNLTLKRLEEIAAILQMTLLDILTFGENSILFNNQLKGDYGSSNIVYTPLEIELKIELEKLRVENEAFKREIIHLKEMIELLKVQLKV